MRLIDNRYERQTAIQILAKEYLIADNVAWMLRKKTLKNMSVLFHVILSDAQAKKGAFLSENSNGVLLIYRQDNRKMFFTNFLRKIYVLFFVTGISRGIKSLKWQKKVQSIRPKDGWLGIAFAIQNDENKMKTAFEFKQEMIKLSQNSNLPIYAETTVPRVKMLYESFGFEVYHEMKHDYAELTVWFLVR